MTPADKRAARGKTIAAIDRNSTTRGEQGAGDLRRFGANLFSASIGKIRHSHRGCSRYLQIPPGRAIEPGDGFEDFHCRDRVDLIAAQCPRNPHAVQPGIPHRLEHRLGEATFALGLRGVLCDDRGDLTDPFQERFNRNSRLGRGFYSGLHTFSLFLA